MMELKDIIKVLENMEGDTLRCSPVEADALRFAISRLKKEL